MAIDGASLEGQGSTGEAPEIKFQNTLVSDPRAAWHIARENLPQAAEDAVLSSSSPWRQREQQAFAAYAERVISTDVPEDPAERLTLQTDIEALFGEARFRDDGYESDHPSDLAKRIAEKMIDVDLKIPGRGIFAVQTAEMAKMPQARIDALRRQVRPTIGERLSNTAPVRWATGRLRHQTPSKPQ